MEKVYVIYDPLYEKVICVHDKPDIECEVCKPIREKEENRAFYPLVESEHEIHSKVN